MYHVATGMSCSHLSDFLLMEQYLAFVRRLLSVPGSHSAFNPYAGDSPAALARCHNLNLYLKHMAERRPQLLLVGEAPGYRGGRVTGVPFTSAAILLSEPAPFGLFGRSAGYLPPVENSSPTREATATMLWDTLLALGELPLLWNAYPIHPHMPHQPASNRAPTTAELQAGVEILADLLRLYPIEQVIAVGNKAAAALTAGGISAAKVRHPSHGGRAAFAAELAATLGRV